MTGTLTCGVARSDSIDKLYLFHHEANGTTDTHQTDFVVAAELDKNGTKICDVIFVSHGKFGNVKPVRTSSILKLQTSNYVHII